MQNPMTPTNAHGVFVPILQPAAEPISHVEGALPVHSEHPSYSSVPKPLPNKRRNSKQPKTEATVDSEGPDHAIDDYA